MTIMGAKKGLSVLGVSWAFILQHAVAHSSRVIFVQPCTALRFLGIIKLVKKFNVNFLIVRNTEKNDKTSRHVTVLLCV